MAAISSEELRSLLKVYFIMGSVNCKKNPLDVIREAIAGGITMYQFREKGEGALTGPDKVALAGRIQSVCKRHGIPFIVNDDIELALSLDADGVHIGQEDEPADIVRSKIGDKILGVSVHTLAEAERAVRHGADYLGLGPVYPTETKKDAKAVQGTSLIRLLREKGMTVPIVGIGGITPENAKPVIDAGADGVAVITAISLADSAYEAAGKLRKAVDEE